MTSRNKSAMTVVWVVEDNLAYRKGLVRILGHAEGLGGIRQFGAAEEVLEAIRQGPPPDVILLDVELPGMNGLAAIEQLKAQAPETQVLIISVFDDDDKVFRAVCSGASGYLLKTAPPEDIVRSIREAMAGGAPMAPKVARSVLEMFSKMGRPKHEDYGLTDRECETLELMTQGLVMKEIARRLDVSYHTVDSHLRNIYAKLHVNTRGAAVAKALKEKLL